jgi:hypothetical protein
VLSFFNVKNVKIFQISPKLYTIMHRMLFYCTSFICRALKNLGVRDKKNQGVAFQGFL